MTEASIENLAWYAMNHRIAPQHIASKELDALEEFVSKMCAAASDRWRDEWSEQCNENQILHNTCDEALAFIKELTKERDALTAVLAEIAQIDPYNTSSMGFVVAKAQAAILRHNAVAQREP
jgi:hypothetical protein